MDRGSTSKRVSARQQKALRKAAKGLGGRDMGPTCNEPGWLGRVASKVCTCSIVRTRCGEVPCISGPSRKDALLSLRNFGDFPDFSTGM